MTTSAHELTARLADLLRNERAALAEFLVVLADFDRRRLWAELGHASLFYFLHRELGLSKGPAFYRKTAAELIQRYPEIVEPLRDGRICLTSIVEVAKVITPENRAEVLPRFFALSKREAREVSAALLPACAPPLREVVTVVRAPASAASPPRPPAAPLAGALISDAPRLALVARPAVLPEEPARANRHVPDVACTPRGQAQRPALEIDPLTADLRRLHVTVSRRLLDKLDAARAALSHSHPGASADEILEAGLDLLLDRAAKRRGLVQRPRKSMPAPEAPEPGPANAATDRGRRDPKARYIPADVRRAVWLRDGGRCQFPLASGGVCGSTHRLEIDHIRPVALGGESTVEGCRLLCKPHNDLAAREAFGDAWMDRYTGRGR